MTRIGSPGYTRPGLHRYREQEFAEIEAAWETSPEFRKDIQDAAEVYLIAYEVQKSSPKPGEVRELVEHVASRLESSAKVLRHLHDRALSGDGKAITAFDLISVKDAMASNLFGNNLSRLEQFANQCEAVSEAAKLCMTELQGRSGRERNDALRTFIEHLGKIYSRATGRRPRANWSESDGCYRGRFLSGVDAALKPLGDEHQKHNSALASVIDRIARDKKKG